RRDPPQGPGSMAAVYDLERGELAAAVSGHDRTFRCLALLADGKKVACSSGAHDLPAELLLYDTRTGKVPAGRPGRDDAAAAGPGADDLVSASLDGMVKVWDVKESKERLSLLEPGVSWRAVARADGGAVVAGGGKGKGGVVRVWDADGNPGLLVETPAPVSCV